jgi:hypothetical protein
VGVVIKAFQKDPVKRAPKSLIELFSSVENISKDNILHIVNKLNKNTTALETLLESPNEKPNEEEKQLICKVENILRSTELKKDLEDEAKASKLAGEFMQIRKGRNNLTRLANVLADITDDIELAEEINEKSGHVARLNRQVGNKQPRAAF